MNNTLPVEFVKMHNLGNDFVIINLSNINDDLLKKDFIIKISNRRIGVGCDQFITYKQISDNRFSMFINNADGSVAKACGNATLCLTSLLEEEKGGKNFNINISGRDIECKVLESNTISINMGKASFNAEWMPSEASIIKLANIYQIELQEMVCVDVGNPHLVIFKQFTTIEEYRYIAQNIEKDKIFTDGVNIHFVTVRNKNLYLKSWERGLNDFSPACGSGACATFAAAIRLGFINEVSQIHFELGYLTLTLDKDRNIIVQGTASKSFKGIYFAD